MRNQRLNASQANSTGSNLADLGWAAARTRRWLSGNSWIGIAVVGREATVKVCGVAVARLQGQSWAPNLSSGSEVNVGTTLAVPSPGSVLPGGKVRCRLMPSGWDGGPVVVRGRESRLHGEGVQQVRGVQAGRGGRL